MCGSELPRTILSCRAQDNLNSYEGISMKDESFWMGCAWLKAQGGSEISVAIRVVLWILDYP